jgi:hypothetical protein
MGCHPSHKTRISMDASTYDEICVLCNATDEVPGGWGQLAYPCPKAENANKITEVKLTKEQKLALIDYLSGYETKAVLEDVDEVGGKWTEENDEALREAVESFLDDAFRHMRVRVEDNG